MKTPRQVGHALIGYIGAVCPAAVDDAPEKHSSACNHATAVVQDARANGLVAAYAALPRIRARYTLGELAVSLVSASTELDVDPSVIRDWILVGVG